MTDGLIAEEGVKLMKKVAAENKPFFSGWIQKTSPALYLSKKYWDMYKRADFRIDDFQEIAANATSMVLCNSNENARL